MSSSVLEVHNNIQQVASESGCDKTRVISQIKPGQAIRQGDVYLTCVEKVSDEFNQKWETLQVANGNTKGSRHVLVESKGLKLLKKANPSALEGPAIVSTEDVHLTHPEHADFILPPGNYITTFQRDFAQEEIAAVKD